MRNPLSGTFDLSGCGDLSEYVQISTGFRRTKNPANKFKVEVWIVPQFVLQKDPRAKAFYELLQTCGEEHRNKSFAVLCNWGGWDDLSWHDVLGFNSKERYHETLGEWEHWAVKKRQGQLSYGIGAPIHFQIEQLRKIAIAISED